MDLRVGNENSEKTKEGDGAFGILLLYSSVWFTGKKNSNKDVCIYLLSIFFVSYYFKIITYKVSSAWYAQLRLW